MLLKSYPFYLEAGMESAKSFSLEMSGTINSGHSFNKLQALYAVPAEFDDMALSQLYLKVTGDVTCKYKVRAVLEVSSPVTVTIYPEPETDSYQKTKNNLTLPLP